MKQPMQVGQRDGEPDTPAVAIRPIAPGDLELETEFARHLSPRTAYLRLMAPRKPTAEELRRFTHIDANREIALIATVMDGGTERQVGVARCVREPEGDRAEFAIVVADAWQRRGVGTALLGAIFDAAFARGVRGVYGITLAENAGMLALARRFGCTIRTEPGAAMYRNIALQLVLRQLEYD
jgi:RimJ/RimL family protein N-acetyltransferase